MPLHWWDLAIIVALGLLFFGPKRLPEMGSALGKTIREFQKSMREVTNPTPQALTPPSAAQPAAPLPAAPAAETSAEASAETLTVAEDAPRVEEDALR